MSSPEERQTVSVYDAQGNLTREKAGIGAATQVVVGSTTAAYGAPQATAYRYDALNRRVGATQADDANDTASVTALGHAKPVTTMVYDTQGNMVRSEGPVSTTVQEFDSFGRVKRSVTGSGSEAMEARAQYDAQGNVVAEFKDGVNTFSHYDGVNRRDRAFVGYGDESTALTVTKFEYSVFGVVSKGNGSELAITQYTYDRLGRQSLSRQLTQAQVDANMLTGAGHLTVSTYDAANNRTSSADWVRPSFYNGATLTLDTQYRVLQSTYAFDALGRLVSQTNPKGGVKEFRYDALGRMTASLGVATPGKPRPVRGYEFDQLDRMVREKWYGNSVDAANLTETHYFAYDALGHMVLSSTGDPAAPGSFVRRREYDGLGRPRFSLATGQPLLRYSHDIGSRKTLTLDSAGNDTAYTYDSAGRLVRERYGDATAARAIDFNYEDIYDGHRVGGAPVAAGRSSRVAGTQYRESDTAAAPPVIALTADFDRAGRSLSRVYRWSDEANPARYEQGTFAQYLGSAKGGLSDRTFREGFTGDYKQEEVYTYDAFGQIVYKVTSQFDTTDSVRTPTPYDASGNLPYANLNAARNASEAYRPSKVGEYGMTYDGEGNVTGMMCPLKVGETTVLAPLQLEYDTANRLTSVWEAPLIFNGTKIADQFRFDYSYDAEGNLIGRKETRWPDDVATVVAEQKYVLDGTQTWADLDSQGRVTDRYVHGAGVDQILARVRLREGGSAVSRPFFYLTDRQNTVLEVVSPDKTRVKSNRYIGTSVAKRMDVGSSALADRFEYTGRDFEERVGLQYTRARWLHNATGRFVSEDSLPDTVTGDANPYRYVRNSAANATDPSGHLLFTTLGALAGGLYGGLTGESGWDSEKAFAGAASGALLGAGLDLTIATGGLGAIAGGALIGAGLGGLTSQERGKSMDWSSWASGTAVGAVTGLVGGGAGMLLGRVAGSAATSLGAQLGIGAASSALGNAAGQGATQLFDPKAEFSWRKLGAAALGGALGGGAGWGATRNLMHKAGADAGKLMCSTTAGRWVASNAAGGAVGGFAGDAVDQLAEGKGFDWRQSLMATAMGGLTAGSAAKGSYKSMARACFAAGTKLMARGLWGEGYRAIEEILESDEVLSRSEFDAAGPLEWKRVEETFTRFAEVVNLHANGIMIRTTSEHPFWVVNRGAWVAAQDLGIGDALVGHDGSEVPVEGVAPSGEWVAVYNLRVEDYHTYFVGDDTWGFSVWAHNEYTKITEAEAVEKFRNAGYRKGDAEALARRGAAPGVDGDAWLHQFTAQTTRANVSGEDRHKIAQWELSQPIGGLAYQHPIHGGPNGTAQLPVVGPTNSHLTGSSLKGTNQPGQATSRGSFRAC